MIPKLFCTGALLLSIVGAAFSQSPSPYPNKPIRFVVPGAAGGPTDVPARLVADALSGLIGQRVVVENRVGAGGIVAGEAVARADPNGYTLLYGNSSLLSINAAIYPKMPYDVATAFVPVCWMTNSPQLLVARPGLPARTVKELIDFANANPGKLNFASGGPGTLPHLTYELLRMESGINALHVPYAGGGPAVVALIAGQADVLFDLIRTRVKSGELRALAITGTVRDPELPDVPTIAEAGFPNVTSTSWTGVMAPAGTPKEAVDTMNAKLNELLRFPEFQAKARSIGLVPRGGSPEEFDAWMLAERVKWARVVKASGATVN